jgi:CRISPR/Cas system-associated exonuclease Cas4 (RecB family)
MTQSIKDPVQALYDNMEEHGIDIARAHRNPVQRFRASEAANCLRQTWYRLSGYRPAPRDGNGQIYGICGDIDHDVTRQLFENFGVEIGGVQYNDDGSVKEQLFFTEEFSVETPAGTIEVVLSTRADGEIDTPRGKSALLEIKGKGYWVFDWLQKAFTLGFRSAEHGQMEAGHEAMLQRVKEKDKNSYWQTQVTMKLSKKDICYLLYKDRSSGQLGVVNDETGERSGVYVEFDPELFQTILERFAFIKRKLMEGKPPAPEFSAGSKECSYCPFNYMCHGAEERRVKGLKPVVLYPGPQMEIHLEDKNDDDYQEEPN